MAFKLFKILSHYISYTFAVAFFSMLWAFVSGFYAFYFLYATVEFSRTDVILIVVSLSVYLTLSIFIHAIHYGLLFHAGFGGFTASIRYVNRMMANNYIFEHHSNISTNDIVKLYRNIVYMPRNNFIASMLYAGLVLVTFTVAYYLYEYRLNNIQFLMIGGFFASVIYGYFTFNITEYFIGPVKGRIEELVTQRVKNFQPIYLLSFSYKSFFTMVLISSIMILLTVIIRTSERPLIEIILFIVISLTAIGFLIYLLVNAIGTSLTGINRATRDLASGGRGLYYPTFTDRELMLFSTNYNAAALEIYRIRADLARNVAERTEELGIAYHKLNDAYRQIQTDLNVAKKIQERILPRKLDTIAGISVAAWYYPMSEVGGDIYDISELSPGYVRIFIADAAGHGVQAALVTMIIKSEYEKVKLSDNPSMLVTAMNNSYISTYESLNVFFSCIVVDIDIMRKKMLYTSAGHPDQLYLHDGAISLLSHTGKLVGIVPDTEYDDVELDMVPAARLILFTDGLYEEINDMGEEFGEDTIRKLILANADMGIRPLTELIISHLKNFTGQLSKISVSDDITLLGIEFPRGK